MCDSRLVLKIFRWGCSSCVGAGCKFYTEDIQSIMLICITWKMEQFYVNHLIQADIIWSQGGEIWAGPKPLVFEHLKSCLSFSHFMSMKLLKWSYFQICFPNCLLFLSIYFLLKMDCFHAIYSDTVFPLPTPPRSSHLPSPLNPNPHLF